MPSVYGAIAAMPRDNPLAVASVVIASTKLRIQGANLKPLRLKRKK